MSPSDGRRQKVLIVRLSALGDVVQGTGVVAALAELHPEFEIHWVVQKGIAPILDGVPGLVTVHQHDRRGGPLAFLRTALGLRKQRFDVALDFQGNWKSALMARLSGARRVIGPGRRVRREASSSVLAGETVSLGPGLPAHPAVVAWAVARKVASDLHPATPVLVATAGEKEREVQHLATLGVDATKPFRVLIDAPRSDPRRLSPGAIAKASLTSLPLVLLRGPDEDRTDAPKGLIAVHHERGELRRLVALGALLADCGGDAFGPDKGASHVLTAAGARVTVLFGPTDPSLTGPPDARALVSPEPPECSPCHRTRCVEAAGNLCMAFHQEEAVERHRPDRFES